MLIDISLRHCRQMPVTKRKLIEKPEIKHPFTRGLMTLVKRLNRQAILLDQRGFLQDAAAIAGIGSNNEMPDDDIIN